MIIGKGYTTGGSMPVIDGKKYQVVHKDYVLDYTSALGNVIMETESGVGGLTYRSVYGLRKVETVIYGIPNGAGSVMQSYTYGDNGAKTNVVKLYHHQNAIGTTDYLTDNVAGKVTSYVTYDDWGALTAKAVLKMGVRELDLVQDYTGHFADMVLGVYYAKARMYDAGDRRFMTTDPVRGNVADPKSIIQYTYCFDNPLKYIDPDGRLALEQYPQFIYEYFKEVYSITFSNLSNLLSKLNPVENFQNTVSFYEALFSVGEAIYNGELTAQDVLNAAKDLAWDSLSGDIRYIFSNLDKFDPSVKLCDDDLKELAKHTAGAVEEGVQAYYLFKAAVSIAKYSIANPAFSSAKISPNTGTGQADFYVSPDGAAYSAKQYNFVFNGKGSFSSMSAIEQFGIYLKYPSLVPAGYIPPADLVSESMGSVEWTGKDFSNIAKNATPNELISSLENSGWTKTVIDRGGPSGPATILTDPATGMSVRIHANPTNSLPYFRVQNAGGNYLGSDGLFPSNATGQELRNLTHFYFGK